MKQEDIDKLISMNERLLLILGFSSCVMLELGKFVPHEKIDGISWVLEAIENVVYLDKPLPPFP